MGVPIKMASLFLPYLHNLGKPYPTVYLADMLYSLLPPVGIPGHI